MSRVAEWVEAKAERISVSNPVKKDGYTSYEVTHIDAVSSVSRRYRDFFQLRNMLKMHFPGAFVPPLPKKQSLGRFDEDFVASRMRGLQFFMEEILRSPDFHSLNYVIAFWESEDSSQWESLARGSPSKPRIGWMKRNVNSLTVSKQALKNYDDVVENDAVVDVIQKNVKTMMECSLKAESTALMLLKSLESYQVALSLRSRASILCHEAGVIEHNEDNHVVDNCFQLFAEAESSISDRFLQHVDDVNATFVEPLQRCTSCVVCFQKAIDTYNILKKDFVATDTALKKQKASQSDAEDRHSAYEMSAQRVIRDYDRLNESRCSEICSCLTSLCNRQMENCRMINLAWENLERSLLQQTNSTSNFGSDKYKMLSYKSDRSNLLSGIDQAMLAELANDEDEADCISV